MKLIIVAICIVGILCVFIHAKPLSESQITEEEAIDLLRRLTRQAATNSANSANAKLPCKYRKGAWGSCDPQTKQRTRTLTLKKGDASCEPTKTLHKECKGGRKGGKLRNSSKNRGNKNNHRARNSSAKIEESE